MIKDYELKHLLKANIEDFAQDLFNGKTAYGLAESLQTMNEIVDRFVDKYKPEPVKPVLPKKVVLTEEQAEIVESAHEHVMPACYISKQPDDEELLMNAYVNGYTVATEKKYVVYKNLGGKHNTNGQYAQAYKSANHSKTFSWIITSWVLNGSSFQFTESEIEHYGLQDCEKVWCDSDD